MIRIKKLVMMALFSLFLSSCYIDGEYYIFSFPYDGYTCVEINGKEYVSQVFRAVSMNSTDLICSPGSFYFSYHRDLYHDDEGIFLRLCSSQDEDLIVGKRYPLEISDRYWISYNEKRYYVTDGWFLFYDIDYRTHHDCMLSGAFELSALSADSTDIITLTKGTFHRLPEELICYN